MNAITPYLFENESLVRVTDHDGEPWFVAADVCRVLELSNPTKAVAALDDDEVTVITLTNTDGIRGNPNVNIITESGLYALIFRSRKPAAKRFRKWVTSEVLPAIRRTGTYSVGDTTVPRRGPVFGRSAARLVNLDWAEGFLGNKELRVLAALRANEGPDGRVTANIGTLAKITGLSYETVDRATMLFLCIGLLNATYRQGFVMVPRDRDEPDIELIDGVQVLVPAAP